MGSQQTMRCVVGAASDPGLVCHPPPPCTNEDNHPADNAPPRFALAVCDIVASPQQTRFVVRHRVVLCFGNTLNLALPTRAALGVVGVFLLSGWGHVWIVNVIHMGQFLQTFLERSANRSGYLSTS